MTELDDLNDEEAEEMLDDIKANPVLRDRLWVELLDHAANWALIDLETHRELVRRSTERLLREKLAKQEAFREQMNLLAEQLSDAARKHIEEHPDDENNAGIKEIADKLDDLAG